jgi:hypothetical protein
MRNVSRWATLCFLVLTTPQITGAQQRQSTQLSARSTAAVPRLTERHIAAIQESIKGKPSYDFLGLHQSIGAAQRLHVTSNRVLIALRTAEAAGGDGTYTPPSDARGDTVLVACGAAEVGSIFECTRVRVTRPDKVEVKPLSYSAGPNVYTNALGAHWTVREVSATYPAVQLAHGFVVHYASLDRTEWSFEVSREDAEEKLMLKDLSALEAFTRK